MAVLTAALRKCSGYITTLRAARMSFKNKPGETAMAVTAPPIFLPYNLQGGAA